MYHNFIYSDVNAALPDLLQQLDAQGDEVGSRVGRTKELTHVGITLTEPWKREVLLPHRKPNLAAQIVEAMWVLAGRDDVEMLSHYLPRAGDFSDDGKVWRAAYGKRLRLWSSFNADSDQEQHDQLKWLVEHLRAEPGSRRAVLNIWDPVVDTQPGKDVPCNNWLSFNSRLGKLDLMVALRSNDIIWGWSGVNQFEWSFLQEVVAGLLGLEVGGLHFATTSFHIYDHHWAKADAIVKGAKQWHRPPVHHVRFDATTFDRDLDQLDGLVDRWFQLEYDIRTGSPMVDSYIEAFPEPLMRSWLRVLQWWWNHQGNPLGEIKDSSLEHAALYGSVQPKPHAERKAQAVLAQQPVTPLRPGQSAFIKAVTQLHTAKDASYGPSWKKRGEKLAIMANIARKVDRLGKSETADETSADTAMDLFVYLAKYKTWLADAQVGVGWHLSDVASFANQAMVECEERLSYVAVHSLAQATVEEKLRDHFEQLWELVDNDASPRTKADRVATMMRDAYALARTLWEQEQVEL